MNPLDWDGAIRRLQRDLDANHQSDVNIIGNALRTNNDWDTLCQYSKYTVDGTCSNIGVKLGWETLSPPSQDFHSKQSEVEDTDGEPLEMDEEDPELARKRKELREIEEQIIRKKAALALKKVETFVKKAAPPGFASNEQSSCRSETLRDRVNIILQQRHSLSFLAKVRLPKQRVTLSSLSRDGLLQEDHPLKLRVKALMMDRYRDLCVLPANMGVCDMTLSPPGEIANKGFQRFLSVLNKGVDIDLLSRIVNDDSEDLPLGGELLNIQPPTVENKSNPPFRSEGEQSNSEASVPGHIHTNGGERKIDLPSPERLSLPDDEKNDGGDCSFDSSSRSKSPPPVKKKKKKEEGEKTKVDEQREQLQNILNTLGLSLEVEEMSRLADRTQERLYGKKHDSRQRAESRGDRESLQSDSHKNCRNSSSSSSSSSSRSTSRSSSTSPSRWRSRSRDSKQRQMSERSQSRERSRDGLTRQDSNDDCKEAQRSTNRDKDGKDSEKISTYQHQYLQDQTYPHPDPAAFPPFPDYNLSQYSQCTTYHSGNYSTATNSYWTYTQGAIPPSLFPSEYPYSQNTYHHFPGPVVAPNMIYPYHNPFQDINLFMNPDLSTSEGQIGSASGLRCLQVISTKQSSRSQSCLKQLTKGRKRKGKYETYMKRTRLWWQKKKEKKRQQKLAAKQDKDVVQKVEVSQNDNNDEETEQSETTKRQPTEEEIKANLRKKLEAFNQKVKQKVMQPANSLTSQTS